MFKRLLLGALSLSLTYSVSAQTSRNIEGWSSLEVNPNGYASIKIAGDSAKALYYYLADLAFSNGQSNQSGMISKQDQVMRGQGITCVHPNSPANFRYSGHYYCSSTLNLDSQLEGDAIGVMVRFFSHTQESKLYTGKSSLYLSPSGRFAALAITGKAAQMLYSHLGKSTGLISSYDKIRRGQGITCVHPHSEANKYLNNTGRGHYYCSSTILDTSEVEGDAIAVMVRY